jgi:osmotically inducible protein OsmC
MDSLTYPFAQVINRSAVADWRGNIQQGRGTVSTESGALSDRSFSLKSRYLDDEAGTNPEELMAAAIAGCFTMLVAAQLSSLEMHPKALNIRAVILMKDELISGVHLVVIGSVEDLSGERFTEMVLEAEKNFPVSRALNIRITTESHLASPFLMLEGFN